jgi:uncharacterized phiE125 gp8 family phage protein
MYAMRITTAPAIEPVTLTEAKLHLRVDHTADDSLITALIVAAREQSEAFTSRAFIEQTITLTFDEFPDSFALPRPPLVSVTSIAYLDSTGASQTLSDTLYRVDTQSEPGRITVAYGQSWPVTYDVTGAVTVVYKAGYGTLAASVPASIKHAILMMVESFYENRGDIVVGLSAQEMPQTSKTLLFPYRAVY